MKIHPGVALGHTTSCLASGLKVILSWLKGLCITIQSFCKDSRCFSVHLATEMLVVLVELCCTVAKSDFFNMVDLMS